MNKLDCAEGVARAHLVGTKRVRVVVPIMRHEFILPL